LTWHNIPEDLFYFIYVWVESKIVATMLSNEPNGFKATIRTSHSLEAMLWMYSMIVTPKWTDTKVCELIAVKVIHISLLNTTVVAFKVLPLGIYALTPVPITPLKTILELIL
jgi:hypothetical protein